MGGCTSPRRATARWSPPLRSSEPRLPARRCGSMNRRMATPPLLMIPGPTPGCARGPGGARRTGAQPHGTRERGEHAPHPGRDPAPGGLARPRVCIASRGRGRWRWRWRSSTTRRPAIASSWSVTGSSATGSRRSLRRSASASDVLHVDVGRPCRPAALREMIARRRRSGGGVHDARGDEHRRARRLCGARGDGARRRA